MIISRIKDQRFDDFHRSALQIETEKDAGIIGTGKVIVFMISGK